jgi:hypothetical protein
MFFSSGGKYRVSYQSTESLLVQVVNDIRRGVIALSLAST